MNIYGTLGNTEGFKKMKDLVKQAIIHFYIKSMFKSLP